MAAWNADIEVYCSLMYLGEAQREDMNTVMGSIHPIFHQIIKTERRPEYRFLKRMAEGKFTEQEQMRSWTYLSFLPPKVIFGLWVSK